MANVLITVDTELSAGLHRGGVGARANFESSILGRCPAGDFGITYQMDVMDRHGLRGVFFVDPLPALVLGEQIIADIVGPIVARGHEIQLHAHPEWLEWAHSIPCAARSGRDMADFGLQDQRALIDYGLAVIQRAGAPRPIAFRAGNFGANDDTLRALAALGLRWDSSVNAAWLGGVCRIGFTAGRSAPLVLHGVSEAPVSGLADGGFRPAQVCALSAWEMRDALRHAATVDHPAFMIVTHSFELLSRDRRRPNRVVAQRFAAMARTIAETPGLQSLGFAGLDPSLAVPDVPRPPANRLRRMHRIAAQALANLRAERALRGR